MSIFQTKSILRFPYSKGGIMLWSAPDREYLKQLVQKEMEKEFNKYQDEYLDQYERYSDSVIITCLEQPSYKKLFYTVDNLINESILIKEDSQYGLLASYIDY